MHKSRLAGFIIDCKTDDLEGAAGFWLRALGYARRPSQQPQDDGYVVFETAPSDLDIETDDVAAEVRRLQALGARRVTALHDWVVMEAPTGHRFCVVQGQYRTAEDDGGGSP